MLSPNVTIQIFTEFCIIELSNFAFKIVSSKCTIPSETEGEGEVHIKMYGKCMGQRSQLDFSGLSNNGI